jgi:predicted ATPase
MDKFVLISGCSGGGKSTLLAELKMRGYSVVEEPGRRIVEAEIAGNGAALPWVHMAAFAERAVDMTLSDRVNAITKPGLVFFDRGLVDALAATADASEPEGLQLAKIHRYNQNVFLTPPWPEIYAKDEFRRHGLDEAVAEYDRLTHSFVALGYKIHVLPKITVAERADLILARLGLLEARI